jgi:hypothetical protein
MKVIYKYPLLPLATQRIELPRERKFLSLQTQGHNGVIWYLIDDLEEDEEVVIKTFMTGQSIPESKEEEYKYLGTYQLGALVFHVCEELK